jgi:hypothetical protein
MVDPAADKADVRPGTPGKSGERTAPGGRRVWIAFLSIVTILFVVFGVMPHASPLGESASWAFRIAISLLAGLAAGALTGTIGFKNSLIRAGGGAAFAVFVLVTSTHQTSENAAATTVTAPLATAASRPVDLQQVQRNIEGWAHMLQATQGSKGGFRCALFGARPEQPWTTAQVLTATVTKPGAPSAADVATISSGLHYLDTTRLSSGGWPLWENGTFAMTEIAAWVALARVRVLAVPDIFNDKQREQMVKDLKRDLTFIAGRQVPSGAWAPIGNHAAENVGTYATVMSLWALLEASNSKLLGESMRFDTPLRLAINWLLDEAYSEALGGWVPRQPTRHLKRYTGLTAQTLVTLLRAKDDERFAYLHTSPRLKLAVSALLDDPALLSRDANDNETVDGEDTVMINAGISIEGSSFLWVPWTTLLAARVAHDPDFSKELRARAALVFEHVAPLASKVEFEKQGTYCTTEYTICSSEALRLMDQDGTDR